MKIFIDGSAGTTGLQIYERLGKRSDISLITLSEEKRKNAEYRKEAINNADIAFLCLPDDAAREAVSFAENGDTVIIDTSTAHRTDENWIYGFPEFKGYKEKIAKAKRIANPGCHASGFLALVKPLTDSGIIKKDETVSCFSVTGYSGGGKKMIAEYENPLLSPLYKAPRQYGLSQTHKHLKEMTAISGLEKSPVFCPVVANFYSGMEVTVMLSKDQIDGDIKTIAECYKNYYVGRAVYFEENADENGFLSAAAKSGRDDMALSVFGNGERIILVSRFDNLGKGASGAAIQNMNIVMGCDEYEGLNVREDL